MIQLSPWQEEVAKSNKRFRVINAGRRAGKTVLSIEEMITCAIMRNDARIAYIAPTNQQARDIAWESLKKRIQAIATNINETRLEIVIQNKHKTTSKIALRGWESIETLRGQAFDLVVLDEVASMRNFTIQWNEIIRPTLTDKKGLVIFISTPKGFNHFYDLYKKVGEDWQSFHYTSYDNPNIPKEEIDSAQRDMSEDTFAQEYMGDFRKQQGLVFKDFSRDRHVFTELPKNVARKFTGVDFGFRNPCSVMQVWKDFDDRYWVVGEWYHTGKTEDEIAEYVSKVDTHAVYPDPENPSAIEVLKRRGIYTREVVKDRGSVVAGVNIMKDLFRQGRIRIHNSCENLIQELESYHYDEDNNDKNDTEAPVKDGDHAIDAVRYVIMMTNTEPAVDATFIEEKTIDNPFSVL